MPELSEISAFFVRHYMLCGGWLVVLALLVVMQAKIMIANVKKTTTATAVFMANKEDGLFVDIRSLENFKKGHITNAINITASEIKEGKVQRIERNKDKPVIVVGKDKFDTECFNSARELKKLGFTRVFVLDGGIIGWSDANLPLTVK